MLSGSFIPKIAAIVINGKKKAASQFSLRASCAAS